MEKQGVLCPSLKEPTVPVLYIFLLDVTKADNNASGNVNGVISGLHQTYFL